jgi:hypothetical protein
LCHVIAAAQWRERYWQVKLPCSIIWRLIRKNATGSRTWAAPRIISYAVWPNLLAARGITVGYESIRLWWIKFGGLYARRLKRKHRGCGATFFIDEVFAGVPDQKINGKQHYLWRAVDQDGEVVDVYLQAKRDGAAVTTLQLNDSSKGYCAVMVANRERL